MFYSHWTDFMHQSIKIISLNTWGGMGGTEGLLSFFKTYQDTDLFCLQETWNGGAGEKAANAAGRSLERVDTELLPKIKAILPDHVAYFHSQHVSYFGITIFVRRSFSVIDEGAVCVYREPGYVSAEDIADHARILQYLTLETGGGLLTVCNIHGAWQPGGKTDTPERLDQSQRIINFTNRFSHPLILAGDFNLTLNTRSVQMIEEAGWENLIRTHGVTSTRTSFYDKPEKFADYVFTKNGVNAEEFRVLPEQVSDHSPLFLSCALPI